MHFGPGRFDVSRRTCWKNVVTAKRHYRYRGITAFPVTVSSSNTHAVNVCRQWPLITGREYSVSLCHPLSKFAQLSCYDVERWSSVSPTKTAAAIVRHVKRADKSSFPHLFCWLTNSCGGSVATNNSWGGESCAPLVLLLVELKMDLINPRIGLDCIRWDDYDSVLISNHCSTVDAVSFKLCSMNV